MLGEGGEEREEVSVNEGEGGVEFGIAGYDSSANEDMTEADAEKLLSSMSRTSDKAVCEDTTGQQGEQESRRTHETAIADSAAEHVIQKMCANSGEGMVESVVEKGDGEEGTTTNDGKVAMDEGTSLPSDPTFTSPWLANSFAFTRCPTLNSAAPLFSGVSFSPHDGPCVIPSPGAVGSQAVHPGPAMMENAANYTSTDDPQLAEVATSGLGGHASPTQIDAQDRTSERGESNRIDETAHATAQQDLDFPGAADASTIQNMKRPQTQDDAVYDSCANISAKKQKIESPPGQTGSSAPSGIFTDTVPNFSCIAPFAEQENGKNDHNAKPNSPEPAAAESYTTSSTLHKSGPHVDPVISGLVHMLIQENNLQKKGEAKMLEHEDLGGQQDGEARKRPHHDAVLDTQQLSCGGGAGSSAAPSPSDDVPFSSSKSSAPDSACAAGAAAKLPDTDVLGQPKSSRWIRASAVPMAAEAAAVTPQGDRGATPPLPIDVSKTPGRSEDQISSVEPVSLSTPFGTPQKVSDVPYAQTPQSLPRLPLDSHAEMSSTPPIQSFETPSTNLRQEDNPGIAIEESASRRGPGRKRKEAPLGFERVTDGGNPAERGWIAPDKTKCANWPKVVEWMQKNRPYDPWSSAQANKLLEHGNAAIDEDEFDAEDPPQDIAQFLGFLVFYLAQESDNEDSLLDLLNGRPPTVNGLSVNLSELFHIVREHGGKEKMHMRLWKSVLQTMKLSASTQDTRTIELIYDRFLLCCEGKTWNDEELRQRAEKVSTTEKKPNLKTLVQRGYVKVGQQCFWAKRRVDYECEGKTPKQIEGKTPKQADTEQAIGIFNEDGQIEFDGVTYKSCSAFASAAFMHFGLGPKSKADKVDGWHSVKIKALDGKMRTLSQVKNEYVRKKNEHTLKAILEPHAFFSRQGALLRAQKDQAQMREKEETERQLQLEREKLLASNPPPDWIPPQQDARYYEEVANGTREPVVSMDFEKMIVGLETSTAVDDLDLAESSLQQIVDSVVQENQQMLACWHISPMVLNHLTKCCWSWACRSSFAVPYGTWQITTHDVNHLLQNELDPKKGKVHWMKRHGADGTSLRSSIMAAAASKYGSSKLPPDWRRERRNFGDGRGSILCYTYFAPDGKTFKKWPDALAYYVEMEDKKIKESEKLNGVTGSMEQAAAGETEPKDQGAGGGEEEKGGGDKQMVDVNEDAEDDEEGDDDEEMGDEEEGERREAPHASFTTTQVKIPTCKMVQRQGILGHSYLITRHGGLEAARYARLTRAYILLLKLVCRTRGGLARLGSHGPTLQLLIEIILAELPAQTMNSPSIESLSLELLIAVAHVINLKVAPGKRLLKAISQSIKMQGKDLSSHELRYALVHLLARLADCPHNKQVMVEQEHEVLPAVLPLMIFPQHVGGFKVLSMALDAVHRFSSFGAVPSVLKRIISTPDCISALVRIVGGAYEPLHTREHPSRPKGVGRVQLRDRIHAARVLLKVAEGFGGISSLQRHEKELVQACMGGSVPLDGRCADTDKLNVLQAGILHALVPTEAPYLRMLENYEPSEHASVMQD